MIETASARLYAWLIKRSAGSAQNRVRADGLIGAATAALKLDLVEAREALRHLRQVGDISYIADLSGLPFSGFLYVKIKQVSTPVSLSRWRNALHEVGVSEDISSTLLPLHEMIDDLSQDDIERLAAGFKKLKDEVSIASQFSFDLSAKYLLGSSKVLDRLPEAAKRILNIAGLSATPRYIVVAGPVAPEAVLLIENTTTFEVAVQAGLASTTRLIAAYGYGLNMMMDSIAGWSLVDSIMSGNYEVLSRLGGPHSIGTLFSHPNIFFWGDLDREGLRIAHALRSKISNLRLSRLYLPMIEALNSDKTSHSYSKLTGKSNQAPWRHIGDTLFDQLAQKCATRAVDQEFVGPDLIFRLGSSALELT